MRKLAILFAATGLLTAQASDWPQWRGPEGQGHVLDSGYPSEWSESSHVLWKTSIPGRGWSSPVLMGDQVWVTTAIEKEASPEDIEERLKANTGNQPLTLLEEVRLHAVCLDRHSGKIVQDVEMLRQSKPQWVHRLNSYASPTPVMEEGRLYAHFGDYGTACVDTRTGKVLWRNQDLRIMHENGPGSSPVLHGDHLIFHLDGSDSQSIAALDKNTGRLAWRTPRTGEMDANPQLQKAYGTPLVLAFNGREELLSTGSNWLYSYDPETGNELWKLSYGQLGFSIVPRPVYGHGMIYLSTSFMRSKLIAVKYDGSAPASIEWSYTKGVPKICSPILVGNEIYFVNDSGGILTCLDALTGEEIYRERLGGDHNASPILADGKLFFFNREGQTIVVQPGRTFKILQRNQLDGELMATPAAADGSWFIRTDRAVYRIGVK